MTPKQLIKHHNERSMFWLAFSVLAFIMLVLFIAAPGCSSSDDDDDKPNASDVAQCKKTVDVMENCIGMEAMGTTVSEAKSECEKGDFDAMDECLFDCEQTYSDCESLVDCFDGC